jgi:mono/diheme cytochrome c family protein
MLRKISLIAGFVLCIELIFIIPVFAGGWAVVTLDHLPTQVVAGEPVEIGFMLRGHGVTPITGDGLSVEGVHLDSGERLSITAQPGKADGHYLAELVFPLPGAWEWGISMGSYTTIQPMPNLMVLPATSAPQTTSFALFNTFPLPFWMLLGLSLTISTALLLRRKSTWGAMALLIVMLAVGGIAIMSSSAFVSDTGSSTEGIAAGDGQFLAATGMDLFVAKGCVICHTHSDIPDRYVAFQTNVGPNLTSYSATQTFLRLWLSDPTGVKPKTQMPNLELSDAEIEALISFLNGES